jgi:hypothetical protein
MTHTSEFKNVEPLINRFGGMRPMARKVSVPVSTIQGWKKRDTIPADRVEEVIRAARANNISMEGYAVSTHTSNQNVKDSTGETKSNGDTSASSSSSASPTAPKREETNTSPARPRNFEKHDQFSKDYSQKKFGDMQSIRRDIVKRSAITTVSILAIVGLAGYLLFGNDVEQAVTVADKQQAMESRLNNVQEQYNSFEKTVTDGLNSVNAQVTDIAAAVGIERNADGEIILNNNMSLTERMAAVESRLRVAGEEIDLGALATRFQNLTTAFEGSEGSGQAFTDLASLINNLQGRIEELDAGLEQAKADNAAMAESLGDVTGRDLSAAAMLLALTQMRDSLNRAEPFAEDLAVLQNLVGQDDPELTASINRLAPYAENGILTPEGLSGELKGVAGEIIASALRGEDVSVQDRIMARMGQILSVQKDGQPVIGIEEQAIVSRAQAALERGDTRAALNELQKLEGEAATAANPVTSQLKGAVMSDETITSMMQNIVNKLQNPDQARAMIKNLPREVERAVTGNGTVVTDPESGLTILRQ